MTEYDYFPPIRFRFSGDVEQARARIPQARTLMAQLIRRMEGFERDAGQWQGQLDDGTQFRVAKMGDVHVADIFGVAPQAQPAAMSGSQPVSQRELLMRPHGEAFGDGNGDYLWVGARLLYEAVYPLTTPGDVAGSLSYIWNTTAPSTVQESTSTTRLWYKNKPAYAEDDLQSNILFNQEVDGYDAGVVAYNPPGEKFTPSPPTGDNQTVELAVPNIMVFEPGWNDGNGTVFQSYTASFYGQDSSIQDAYLELAKYSIDFPDEVYNYGFGGSRVVPFVPPYKLIFKGVQTDYIYWDSEQEFTIGDYNSDKVHVSGPFAWAFNGYPTWACGDVPSLPSWSGLNFRQEMWTSTSGMFTTMPMYYSRYTQDRYPVQAAITLDAEEIEVTYDQCYPRETIFGDTLDIYTDAIWGREKDFTGSFSHEKNRWEVVDDATIRHSWDRTDYSHFYKMTDTPVEESTPYRVKGEVKVGLYEVRLSSIFRANGIEQMVGPDRCEVYIQLARDEEPRVFTVTIPNTSADAYFDLDGWLDNGIPTATSDAWYPGCWLIDVKNKTIIHETNPANLDRPWFS